MADIEAELQALRGQIARVKSELEGLAEAESMLSDKLRKLGLDESMTTVDLPTVAGLPSRRKKGRSSSSSALPPPSSSLPWIPAAVGAGLLLGVAIVVLLALNLQQAKRAPVAESVPVAAPPITSVVVPVQAQNIPPPPSVTDLPAPTASVNASAEAAKPEMGSLSIVCTPRCDSIIDNGVPLTPGNVVALPVPAGPHKVVATAGSVKRTMNVTVEPGKAKELRIDLERQVHDRGF